MKLGYTIIYVPNVLASIEFYERAFGMQRGFVHEGGDYAELATGETTLSFAAHSLGHTNLPNGYIEASASPKPLGIELHTPRLWPQALPNSKRRCANRGGRWCHICAARMGAWWSCVRRWAKVSSHCVNGITT
jgi:catechol 2,3-dioxygenase-like lactoylglutathione lyase family enzyme